MHRLENPPQRGTHTIWGTTMSATTFHADSHSRIRWTAALAGISMAATALIGSAQAQAQGQTQQSVNVPAAKQTYSSQLTLALATDINTYVSRGITTDNLNVRSGPSASYRILTFIPSGTTVTLYYKHPTTGWYRVYYGGTWGCELYVCFAAGTLTDCCVCP